MKNVSLIGYLYIVSLFAYPDYIIVDLFFLKGSTVFLALGSINLIHIFLVRKKLFVDSICFLVITVNVTSGIGFLLFTNGDGLKDILYFCFYVILFICMRLYLINLRLNRETVLRILNTILYLSIIIALIGLIEWWVKMRWPEILEVLLGIPLEMKYKDYGIVAGFRPSSLLGNALVFGEFSAWVGCISTFLFFQMRRQVYIVSASVNLLMVVLSQSRSGFIAAVIGMMSVFFLCRPLFRPKETAIAVIATIILSLACIYYFLPRDVLIGGMTIFQRMEEMYSDINALYRFAQWQQAVDSIITNPLFLLIGRGPGSMAYYFSGAASFDIRFDIAKQGSIAIENGYLFIFYQYGVLGLLVMSFLTVSFIKEVIKKGILEYWRICGIIVLGVNALAFDSFYVSVLFMIVFTITLPKYTIP